MTEVTPTHYIAEGALSQQALTTWALKIWSAEECIPVTPHFQHSVLDRVVVRSWCRRFSIWGNFRIVKHMTGGSDLERWVAI